MINPNPKNKFILQIIISVVSLTAMGFSTVSILRTLKEDGISEGLKDRFRDVLSAQSFNQSYLPGPLSNIDPETELILYPVHDLCHRGLRAGQFLRSLAETPDAQDGDEHLKLSIIHGASSAPRRRSDISQHVFYADASLMRSRYRGI